MVSEGNRYGGQRHGGDYEGTAGTESSGGLWSGLESPVLDRSGKAGEERLGEVGCGLQRQDAAGGERCDQERKGRAELGQAWQVWRGRWAW